MAFDKGKQAGLYRFTDEFRSESDRGCAVLVMCVLEDALRDLFEALVADPTAKLDTLFPPGNQQVSTQNALLLGLMNKEEVTAFRGLAGIRNTFAHALERRLQFDSPKIASKIGNLEAVLPMALEYLKSLSYRNQFLTHAALLHSALWYRTIETTRLKVARRLESPPAEAETKSPSP